MTTIGPSELSLLTGRSERHERRLALSGVYGEIRRGRRDRNGRAIHIHVENLPADLRAKFYEEHPHLAPRSAEFPPSPQTAAIPLAWQNITLESQRVRATLRRKAVLMYERFLSEWRGGRGITAAKERWAEAIGTAIPELAGVSVDSLERWVSAYRAFDLDGLVDRNDGSARRGKTVISRRLRSFFFSFLTSGDMPTVMEAIRATREFAEQERIACGAADDAFQRLAQRIPETLKRATGGDQDDDSKWLVTISRSYDFPALRIVQSDHHISDVWVHCGDPECKRGHRVWITPFIDVASRAVLSCVMSLDYPNSERILLAFRQLVEKWGIPEFVYVDNGKDFKSAFGRAIRRGEAMPIDETLCNGLLASLGVRAIFAIKYNARAKTIERLFRTWVEQIWKGDPGYVGRLGKRTDRAHARYQSPEQLVRFDQFVERMNVEIDLYNQRGGHRGRSMNGRSPMEVFAATRIPRRDPDPLGLKIAFWSWYGRQVRAGGKLVVGSDEYQIDPLVAFDLLGRNVQLLVDPDDVKRAIVLSGCEHTNSKVSRVKALRCKCPKGAFLCEATLWGPSTFDTEEPITRQNLEERGRINRELRKQIRQFNSAAARRDLQLFMSNRPEMLRAIRDRQRNPELLAKAAGHEGAVTALLPQSPIARRLERYRDTVRNNTDPLSRLSVADREIASSAPPVAESRIDQLLAEIREASPHLQLVTTPIDNEHLQRERERLQRERKADAGLCWFDGCERQRTRLIPDAEECGPHWLEIHATELDPEAVNALRTEMEDEG